MKFIIYTASYIFQSQWARKQGMLHSTRSFVKGQRAEKSCCLATTPAVLFRHWPAGARTWDNLLNKSTCSFTTNIMAPNLTNCFSPAILETCLGAHLFQWCELMLLCAESPNDLILVLMYFWLHEGLRFIKLVWAVLRRELNIIKHLVNGFTTAEIKHSGKASGKY